MSKAEDRAVKPKKRLSPMKWETPLRDQPPGDPVAVSSIAEAIGDNDNVLVGFPEIELYCSICSGERIFMSRTGGQWFRARESRDLFIPYLCRNCWRTLGRGGAHLTRQRRRLPPSGRPTGGRV